MMRVLLTAAAYLASLAVLAPVLFFLVLVLAGPHSSLLPSRLQPAVVIAGWLTLLLAPIAIAARVWRRHS
jgi:hypothetical protein